MALRRLLQRNLDYTGMRLSSGYGQGFEVSSCASLAAVWPALVGIITFFTSVCAVAAWPFAIVNLMTIGYVSFAAASIAAFFVLTVSSSASARQQHDFQRFWVSFSSSVALVLALQKLSSLCGCFWVFFPELL